MHCQLNCLQKGICVTENTSVHLKSIYVTRLWQSQDQKSWYSYTNVPCLTWGILARCLSFSLPGFQGEPSGRRRSIPAIQRASQSPLVMAWIPHYKLRWHLVSRAQDRAAGSPSGKQCYSVYRAQVHQWFLTNQRTKCIINDNFFRFTVNVFLRQTGYMFGKGVYFAGMFQILNFCKGRFLLPACSLHNCVADAPRKPHVKKETAERIYCRRGRTWRSKSVTNVRLIFSPFVRPLISFSGYSAVMAMTRNL